MERGRNALASPPAFFSVSPQCLHWLKLVGSQKQGDLENAIYRFHLRVEGNGVAMPCTGRYEIGTEESKSSFTQLKWDMPTPCDAKYIVPLRKAQ